MLIRLLDTTLRKGRRLAIAIAGGFLLLAGVIMIVLPGPAIVAIPAGLGILALEFEWANRWLVVAELRWRRWRRARAEARESTISP